MKKGDYIFNFAQGQYFYVGEKLFEGHKVIEVQYIPQLPGSYATRPIRLVFYIIPEEHQIVKIAIGNDKPTPDFTDIRAMTMAKIENIWLPHKYSAVSFNNIKKTRFYYSREYHSFAKTKVNTNVTFEGIVDTGKEK